MLHHPQSDEGTPPHNSLKDDQNSRVDVTPAMFAEFCRKASGRRHARFPATWVKAFCEAVGSDELQRHLLSERLLNLLTVGETVAEAAQSLKRAQEAVAKITESKRSKR